MTENKQKNIELAIMQANIKKEVILNQIKLIEDKEKSLIQQKSILLEKISKLDYYISSQKTLITKVDSAEK